jgi:hypothetical protein
MFAAAMLAAGGEAHSSAGQVAREDKGAPPALRFVLARTTAGLARQERVFRDMKRACDGGSRLWGFELSSSAAALGPSADGR